MKKLILALSMISSMSLVSCAHGHHCDHGDKDSCKLEKSCGCDHEKMKSGGCKECADKAEEKK